MRLSNFRGSVAIAGLALLTGTVAAPAIAVPTNNITPAQAPPAGAIRGGHEANGTPQYVCVAPFNGGRHPGKTVNGNCNIGWGGSEQVIPIPPAGYAIPVNYTPGWVARSQGQALPSNAVLLGYEANGTALFSCRAPYNGGLHLGKVVAGNCNFGWGGREIVVPNYEVLVAL